MRAWAPGKLVLSGAYSVLEGAPAIVSAVDRYVYCDSGRTASSVTPEVLAALPAAAAPEFNATALRAEGRKLGLGSSAAILVASLAAADPRPFATDAELRAAVFEPALAAHQKAQGGGSGIDVAASTWGGTLIARRGSGVARELDIDAVTLPPALLVEAWASNVSASTPALLAAVAQLRQRAPAQHAALLADCKAAAERAASALRQQQTLDLIEQLAQQQAALAVLGRAAGVPIVTAEVEQLARAARRFGAAVLPSGAGGGDIVLWCSIQASPPDFRDLAASLHHRLLPLRLHARGVHRRASESSSQRGP